jgi:transposase
VAIVACDVSKDRINVMMRLGRRVIEEEWANRSQAICASLDVLQRKAALAGFGSLRVVAEPTGVYHRVLLRTAQRLGLEVAQVSGEAVAKMRVIESNDTGKTDLKDPFVIHTLASLGKTQTFRELTGLYALLREWHKEYNHADRQVVTAKGAVHTLLKQLFPDFDFCRDFMYAGSGVALFEIYQGNPYRIMQDGPARFARRMRKRAPGIRQTTLNRLYAQASQSVGSGPGDRHAALLAWRLWRTWQDYRRHQERKNEVKQIMEELYSELRAEDPKLPAGEPGVISTFHLARLVAETGPLSDFRTRRQLLRYAGLNLREKQSGLFRGQTRGSKKGRRLLRKVLGLVVLPLVRRKELYGDYYHQHKEKMPGTKAMAAVMRKFLKLFWGWYRSGRDFDRSRVFVSASEYRLAA